jgi:hypothetical protein
MNGFTAPVYPDKKPAEPEIEDAFATMTGFANRLLERMLRRKAIID